MMIFTQMSIGIVSMMLFGSQYIVLQMPDAEASNIPIINEVFRMLEKLCSYNGIYLSSFQHPHSLTHRAIVVVDPTCQIYERQTVLIAI